MTSSLLFTADEWPTVTADAVQRMAAYVAPLTTPISKVISEEEGEHCGTGAYCKFDGRRFLLTNEHVAHERETHPLAHKFFGEESYFRLRHPLPACQAPHDTALARIDDAEWARFPHRGVPIEPGQFAATHAPLESELLFVIGYSGERAKFYFNTLFTPGTPYLARECPLPNDPRCNARYHFAVAYNPALARSVDESSHSLPLPPGLSGSLVWNTRVVEKRMLGELWSPGDARVTGIVWGWDSGTCLFATKVEHMRLPELVWLASK